MSNRKRPEDYFYEPASHDDLLLIQCAKDKLDEILRGIGEFNTLIEQITSRGFMEFERVHPRYLKMNGWAESPLMLSRFASKWGGCVDVNSSDYLDALWERGKVAGDFTELL